MSALKDVIYLSNIDYQTLIANGSVVINGTTLTYDADNVYITPDEIATTSSAGLMPALNSSSVATQSQTTKFLREDGTWAAPSYTSYESKSASSGGTAVSLVTTGEKYTWNNKGSYSKPSGGIPASDLAESYYLASNPNGYQTSSDVQTAISSAITNVYKFMGSSTIADLNTTTANVSASFKEAMKGWVYNITDSGNLNNSTGTTAVTAGDNVAFVYTTSSNWHWDKLAGTIDLSNYVPTSRKINGLLLTSDILLHAEDVGALPSDTTYLKSASVSGSTLTLTKQDNTTVTFTASGGGANYYPTRSYSSGLQISTSSGVTDTCALYVPYANGTSQAGVVSTTAQTFGGSKTINGSSNAPITLKSNSTTCWIDFKNSSNTALGSIGVNSSKKPVFYDTSEHQLAYKSDLTGIHETGSASLESYYYFNHTVYGSGKILITSMQDPYSSWNFNLECNGDAVVSSIVYAELIVNREEIVCCNYVDTSGNWNSLGLTGSYDTIDTWRVGTSVGSGDISVDYIGDFS